MSDSTTASERTTSAAVRGGSTSSNSDPSLFRISYGSGEASGELVSDSVTLAGYQVPNQTFASCKDVTEGLLAGPVSGIMGLGFQKIASSNSIPWWENLASNHQLGTNQEMGFAFTRFLHYAQSENVVMPGGVASFGSANQTLYSGGEFILFGLFWDLEYPTSTFLFCFATARRRILKADDVTGYFFLDSGNRRIVE